MTLQKAKRKSRRMFNAVESLERRAMLSVSATAHVDVVSTSGTGSGTVYNYAVDLTNTGTTAVGTFWFGWVPGENFLASKPSAEGSPAGWTEAVQGAGTSADGSSIEWTANSAGSAIAAGGSSDDFTFSSTDSPTVLMANSPSHPASPATTATVYSGAPFSDAGSQFVVTVDTTVPTPAAVNTSVGLTASTAASTQGDSVTFTATVTPASGTAVPTGTVTFLDNGASIGTGTVGTGGVATLATSGLPVGSDVITATYGGDANFNTSTAAAVTETVTAAAVTPAESAAAVVKLVSITGTVAAPVYHYGITLTDTGSTTIGTFWYAWLPGENFLPSVPSSESSPSGWGNGAGTASTPDVTGPESTPDGTGLRWVAQSVADELTPGQSLSGFDFVTTDSPTALAGLSPTHTSTPVGTSSVYAGKPFADAGAQLVAVSPAVPAEAHLQPTLPAKLPTQVLTGGVFNTTVPITITNFSANKSTGSTTVTLYAAPDGTLDGTQIALGSATKPISVRGDKSAVVGVKVGKVPASLNAGTYTLIAAVTDAARTTLATAAAPVLTVATPVVTLSATVAATPVSVAPGGFVTILVTVGNSGNVKSTGLLTVGLTLDAAAGGAAIVVPTLRKKLTIKSDGKPVVLRLRMKISKLAAAGDYQLTGTVAQGAATVVASPVTVSIGSPVTATVGTNY